MWEVRGFCVRMLPVSICFFISWRCSHIANQDHLINEEITAPEVRLISDDGEQLGIMSAAEALRIAEERELDLVKISPQAKPPVCKT